MPVPRKQPPSKAASKGPKRAAKSQRRKSSGDHKVKNMPPTDRPHGYSAVHALLEERKRRDALLREFSPYDLLMETRLVWDRFAREYLLL